jgi:hypothetical protein
MTPALTGCLVHTHSVLKTRLPDVVRNATLDQLLNQVDTRYAGTQSMTLSIQMAITTGGSTLGVVKEYTSLNGYIIVGKPENIRVILLLPFVKSDALDMVSDGSAFKMLIKFPTLNCAILGSDVVNNSAQKGLYSLRPSVILEPLLIGGLRPDQLVSMTQDSRTYPDPKKRKQLINEPDYDLEFLSQPQGQQAHTLRVVHLSRVNLMPWRLDIYNADGKVETQASYDNYQKFGDIDFPTRIVIQRPLDELGLTITISKATFNQKLDSDAFNLDISEGIPVTNMDDPASAATVPCSAHAPQSPH